MSVQKRRQKALIRRQWVRKLRCKWDVAQGRSAGCHNAPWPCEHHPMTEITEHLVTAPGERVFIAEAGPA